MLDTNVLLDWLLDRDAHRTAAIAALFDKASDLHVPDMVVAEVAFALEKFYKLPRALVALNLQKIVEEPVINCNKNLFYRSIGTYERYTTLSFVDCCLLHYAEIMKITPIYTSDKDLAKKSAGLAKLVS